jgi:hypothetical protein
MSRKISEEPAENVDYFDVLSGYMNGNSEHTAEDSLHGQLVRVFLKNKTEILALKLPAM